MLELSTALDVFVEDNTSNDDEDEDEDFHGTTGTVGRYAMVGVNIDILMVVVVVVVVVLARLKISRRHTTATTTDVAVTFFVKYLFWLLL